MTDYRWNQAEMAAGYDAAADLVHPHYVDLQDAILSQLMKADLADGLVIDLGGGSGRLMERILDRFAGAQGMIIDQSQAFLDLAARRLERFGNRAGLVCCRLQDDWRELVERPAAAIISMSAIHHLDANEKQQCYSRCCEVLQPGGWLLNGDEVRATSPEEYREQLEQWARQMDQLIAADRVSPAMAEGLRRWQQRNVEEFDVPKTSGDDCHEPAPVQLEYLCAAGFTEVVAPWSRELWTLLAGQKPTC